MSELCLLCGLLLLQPETPRMTTDAIRFTTITAVCLVVIIVAMYFVFKTLRSKVDHSAADEVRSEFEKSKDALLMAVQAKKADREAEESAQRMLETEQKEIELLRENVDPARVIGQTCPLSNLEMMADQELVIDPYTGQGYHFSSFLNDWPKDKPRPKYIYRYPQGTVAKTDQLTAGL